MRLDHARQAQAEGLTVWRTPRVLPWSAWLRQQWLEARAARPDEGHPRLLTSAQARILWDDVVASSDAGSNLLSPANASRLAARSWQRMQDYLIPLERIAACNSAEAQALFAWCREFLRRCESLQAIDEARLAHWADSNAFVPAEPVTLAGFDHVPTSVQRLIDRWRGLQKVVEPSEQRRDTGTVEVTGVPDPDLELELAARWARAQLEAGSNSVGIVLADLRRRRAQVRRVFEDVFAPGQRCTRVEPAAMPFIIAAPEPLATYPIVDAALLVLQLALAGCPGTHAGRLLRSEFIAGGHSERDRRAMADFRLRQEQRDRWDWFELERWAGVTDCERLQLAARAVGAAIRGGTAQARPSRWAERFHAWLRAAGWPGERALDSTEHQTVVKFQAALAEFGTFDAVLSHLSLPAAVAKLQELLDETPFEPETHAAAVTVIDPTTVAGMSFDALWVAGLDASRLPGPVSPDPLLPIDVQRAAGVPEAGAEGVMQQAQAALRRWANSAPQVVFSWPGQEGEALLQPSPLLAQWPRTSSDKLRVAPRASQARAANLEPHAFIVRSLRQTLFDARPRLDEIADERAAPLPSSDARGGAMTLELQSRCPFRAQAQLRLHALALPRISMGVEPIDRGSILHRVLADLWGELHSQAELLALDERSLAERVRSIAERRAMEALRITAPYRARLATLEVENIVQQVLRLLAVEKQRLPFTVRFAEAAEPYALGGLAITLRPDRIDELSGGGQLLIDYKLGDSHQPRQWLDTRPGRPRRPQLPLYGLAHEQTLQALAFVVLAAGAVEYRGWSNGAQVGEGIAAYPAGVRLRDIPPDWDALLQHWRLTLTRLAEQFVAGDASVDPLPQECTYCHLSVLCRVHEHSRLATATPDADNAESGFANDD